MLRARFRACLERAGPSISQSLARRGNPAVLIRVERFQSCWVRLIVLPSGSVMFATRWPHGMSLAVHLPAGRLHSRQQVVDVLDEHGHADPACRRVGSTFVGDQPQAGVAEPQCHEERALPARHTHILSRSMSFVFRIGWIAYLLV